MAKEIDKPGWYFASLSGTGGIECVRVRAKYTHEDMLAQDISHGLAISGIKHKPGIIQRLPTARPISEYHEDMGPVLWWKFPIDEPPYCGGPNDCGHTVEMRHYENGKVKTVRTNVGGWPGYHTHFTLIDVPEKP